MSASVLLGTQGWSYKSWVGSFYPPDAAVGDYLAAYAGQFRAVEIDSTYYGTPAPQTVKHWHASTPGDFRFTAKFPQTITHAKMLQDTQHETLQFLDTLALLGEKLGPLLLQFPYQFKPDRRETLAQFLAALPRNFRYAVEVRHRGWLDDAFFGMLAEQHVALALTDYAYMPRLERTTTDFAYIRWLGNRRDVPDDQYDRVRLQREADLDHWASLITQFLDRGITIWGFANNHYQGHSPATVRALLERLRP